jgi:eukaryotic-like serine/threonine-protein kinase
MHDPPGQWAAAREQFRRLCDLPRDERRAALQALRATDAALAKYVEELLAGDSGMDDDLLGAVDTLRDDFESALTTSTTPRAGPWRLDRRIGHGGMGEVWRAQREVGGFEQVAALKLLKRGMDSEAMLARFLQERRILARLEHPWIARLLDGGITADGRPYFAMELVQGEPITDYVARCQPSLPALVELFLHICAAVEFAHRNLVVHRDLKPSNILVDASGEPRLLDFGIAKLIEAGDEADPPTLTAAHLRVMTPAYAAPEQLIGDAVTTATDVYSLGLILYELITGALPPQRGNRDPQAASPPAEVTIGPCQALRRQPGSDTEAMRRLRAVRDVQRDLDAIVLTALRHDPARRYTSVAAFSADLSRLLDGRQVSARPDSLAYSAWRLLRRHQAAFAAGALALVALLIGFGVAVWQARIANEALQHARIEMQRA